MDAQLPPRSAAIDGLVKAAVGAAAGEGPREATKVPHARVDDLWIDRIDGNVARTARRTEIERLCPVFSAVERNVDASVRRIFERVAEPACFSKTACHVAPPLVDRHTPPPAVPR